MLREDGNIVRRPDLADIEAAPKEPEIELQFANEGITASSKDKEVEKMQKKAECEKKKSNKTACCAGCLVM